MEWERRLGPLGGEPLRKKQDTRERREGWAKDGPGRAGLNVFTRDGKILYTVSIPTIFVSVVSKLCFSKQKITYIGCSLGHGESSPGYRPHNTGLGWAGPC